MTAAASPTDGGKAAKTRSLQQSQRREQESPCSQEAVSSFYAKAGEGESAALRGGAGASSLTRPG